MNILIIGAGVMSHLVKKEIKNDNLVGMVDYYGNGDFKSFDEINQKVDVIIDFSHPALLKDMLSFAKKNYCAVLIAATGHSDSDLELIKEYSKYIPIIKATNTSVGVNAINKIVDYASKILSDFDIEIVEKHHNRKVDAPSGTASTLYEIINKNKKLKPVYNRHNISKKREDDEIGIHSIRAGNIFGEHTVIFANGDEVIEIKHEALSRSIFAKGSITAANYLYLKKENKENGLFEMGDIL